MDSDDRPVPNVEAIQKQNSIAAEKVRDFIERLRAVEEFERSVLEERPSETEAAKEIP